RVFSDLRVTPTINIDPSDGSPTFSFSATHRHEDLDATLERLLELPAQLGAERKRRVAIVFDEFQEVTEIDPKLPALMRAVFQEQPHVAHVYSGSKPDMMRRLFTNQNAPFSRSAEVLETGRPRAPGVAAQVLAITGGHPDATQELAYALWEVGDLAAAVESVLRSENAHFSLVWDGASRTQRRVLQALAAEPGRVFGSDYRLRNDLPAASSVQRAVEQLVADELVERTDAGYEISEPFLREWVLAVAS